jgi:hypothetical protein
MTSDQPAEPDKVYSFTCMTAVNTVLAICTDKNNIQKYALARVANTRSSMDLSALQYAIEFLPHVYRSFP